MPLTFDMPREELESYLGTNPCPADFDAYWDKGRAEIADLDPCIEIEPADFQTTFARCSHLWFTGTGNARVHAKLLQPRGVSSPHPAVLSFHGYTGSSDAWTAYLPYAAMGYTVAALDCRGQGGWSEDVDGLRCATFRGHIVRGLADGPSKLYYRNVFLDTALLARIVIEMDDVDTERVGATGASQGGGLTLACAALEPRIRMAAPVYPFLCDYQRAWELDLTTQAYAELTDWFRRFDPLEENREEVFTRLGYIDVQHLVPRIEAKVLMAVGLGDKVCPPSTQFAAYNKIRSEKQLRIYPDHGHELLPGNADAIYTYLARLGS